MNDINYIEGYAEEIHKILTLDKKFDINKLVEDLGGVIRVGKLDTGVLAEIKPCLVENEDEFEITLAETDDERKQRFSIAHELGHLFLHMDFLDDSKWDENCKSGTSYKRMEIGNRRKEMEANQFAAAFLMPRKLFLNAVEKNSKDGYCDLDKVSDEFDVSKEAAYYRGCNLGLWK